MIIRVSLFLLSLTPTLAMAGGANEVNLIALDDAANELGQDTGVLRATRSNTSGTLTINATFGGSASTDDFAFSDGGTLIVFQTITFSNGVGTVDITLTPNLDNRVEGQEQFDVALATGAGYTIGPNSTASILVDDDPPVVTLEAADDSADEAGQDVMVFRFARSGGNINQNLTVNVNIDGSSTASLTGGGFDLTSDDGGTLAAFQTVTIFAANATRDITFTPVLDNRIEPIEQLDLSLAAGSYNIDTPSSGSATLADDPPVVTLEAVDDSADESGQDVMVFRFARSGGNVNQNLTVNVNIDSSSTASLSGGGFDLTSDDGGTLEAFQTVTIVGPNASRDITFTPVLDNRVEPVEQLDLSLAGGSYNIGTPSVGSATLADDPPVVSISVVQEEAAEAGPPGVLQIARSGGNVNQALTVNATISAASTVTDSDYSVDDGGTLQVFNTVSIAAGQPSRQLGFSALIDDLVEGEESLIVELLGGNYVLGNPDSGMLIFVDDRLFADSFETVVAVLKACSLTENSKLSSLDFDVLGGQAYDLAQGLIWLRCHPSQSYDWLGGLCGEQTKQLPGNASTALEELNAGRLGENHGVSNWRMATAAEKAAAGFTGSCYVR